MIVPENTIAWYSIIPNDGLKQFSYEVSDFIRPLNNDHKRDWFTSNFYKCLPLTIGNMQGFVFSMPFDFEVFWNGGEKKEDLEVIEYIDYDKFDKFVKTNNVHVGSFFGHGIFTAHMPVILKTPPGVNLMTIAPPNFPLPGLSPMTGVIESDNIKFTFAINVKMTIPGMRLKIKAGTPLSGIIPIPRYFCDSFEIKNAYDIIDNNEIEEEKQIAKDHSEYRNETNKNGLQIDGLYYKGMDFRKNKFVDHQLPGRKQ